MHKKWFAILTLLALLSLGVLSTAAQDVVTINYWDYWVTQGTAVDEAIAVFEAEHPNIDVVRTVQGGGGYDQLVQAAFTAGPDSTADVFVLPTNPTFPDMVQSGWLLPLNDLPGFEEWKAEVPNTDFVHLDGAGNTIDGVTYSTKFWSDAVWIKMFVNTAVYEQAGLTEEDFPRTLEQLVENSRIITENTDAYGLGFSGTQAWAQGWFSWMCQNSTRLYTHAPYPGFNWTTGTFENASNPCLNEVLNTLVSMKSEGLIHPESAALAIDDEAARVLFATNQFAHLIAGNWVIGGWAQTNPEFDDFRIIGLPLAGVEEPQGSFGYGPGGRWFGIAADTQHPEEAWEFFKFLHSPEFADIWIQYADEGLYRMSPEAYGTTEVRADIVALDQTLVPEPNLGLIAPETAGVVFTLNGPTLDDIIAGVIAGQVTDIPAALADLDQRYQSAFDQGIADAQAAGLDVSVEDYLLPDWDPTQPYETTMP